MLSHQEAVALVEREIARLEPLPDGDSWTVYHQRTAERPFGWVFFYGSKMYAQTGEAKYAVAGNAPFIVNRHSGHVEPTGTAKPVEHYIAEYEARFAQQRA